MGAGKISLHFRLLFLAFSDNLLRFRAEIDDADDRIIRVSSVGAPVVYHQLFARGTKGTFFLLSSLLSDSVSNGVQHIDRIKSFAESVESFKSYAINDSVSSFVLSSATLKLLYFL